MVRRAMTVPTRRRPSSRLLALTAVSAVLVLLTSCAGAGGGGGNGGGGGAGGGGGGTSINVLMVGNPQMEDVEKLTAANFTKTSGIRVNFTILPENELRDKVTQDIATQAGQYDVATIGAFEVLNWAGNDWLHEMSSFADKDAKFDVNDLIKPIRDQITVDGKMYALPFYGESSFLMYRKDVFAAKGLTMPQRPTWTQVADFARRLHTPQMAGICLRGLPGWGEVFAPLTTVVNTFGGTWFTKDWQPQVNAPEFVRATKFYVDLVRNYGQRGAPQSGFTECLNTFAQGQAAMWYDATSAAGSVEDPKVSKVAGKVGYVFAPVERTKSSGWLWEWAWAMPRTTKKADAAWQFMSWASGKDYERLVGQQLGWPRVPAGKRQSTYEIPEYQQAAKAFYQVTLEAIKEADPANPGVQPRPTLGIQFVAIPEFADLATKISQEVSAAIAGRTTVEKALSDGQRLAETVAQKYRK